MPSKNHKCRETSFSVKLQNIIITLPICLKIFLVITTQNHSEGWSQMEAEGLKQIQNEVSVKGQIFLEKAQHRTAIFFLF